MMAQLLDSQTAEALSLCPDWIRRTFEKSETEIPRCTSERQLEAYAFQLMGRLGEL